MSPALFAIALTLQLLAIASLAAAVALPLRAFLLRRTVDAAGSALLLATGGVLQLLFTIAVI